MRVKREEKEKERKGRQSTDRGAEENKRERGREEMRNGPGGEVRYI